MQQIKFYFGRQTQETGYLKEIFRFIIILVVFSTVIILKGWLIEYIRAFTPWAILITIPRVYLFIKGILLVSFSITRMKKITENRKHQKHLNVPY